MDGENTKNMKIILVIYFVLVVNYIVSYYGTDIGLLNLIFKLNNKMVCVHGHTHKYSIYSSRNIWQHFGQHSIDFICNPHGYEGKMTEFNLSIVFEN